MHYPSNHQPSAQRKQRPSAGVSLTTPARLERTQVVFAVAGCTSRTGTDGAFANG